MAASCVCAWGAARTETSHKEEPPAKSARGPSPPGTGLPATPGACPPPPPQLSPSSPNSCRGPELDGQQQPRGWKRGCGFELGVGGQEGTEDWPKEGLPRAVGLGSEWSEGLCPQEVREGMPWLEHPGAVLRGPWVPAEWSRFKGRQAHCLDLLPRAGGGVVWEAEQGHLEATMQGLSREAPVPTSRSWAAQVVRPRALGTSDLLSGPGLALVVEGGP